MKAALAIEGGSPVRSSMLPYGRQSVDEGDIAAVVEVLRSDWLTTGPKVAEFEAAFAAYVGAAHAVAVSSGTAALHAAAFACGLKAGDEAITTPLTFAATANCVVYQGARPVFADVRSDTLNLDADRVREKITNRTKALIPVDYTGQPADLDAMRAIAEEHNLTLIEDACHAPGATYKGRSVGALSTMTIFSTHPVKHLTTGEGGIITTDDPDLAHKLRVFRNHGLSNDAHERHQQGVWFYEMVALGYNYRLTDIQCALGLSQLKKVEGWLARRRAIAARYTEAFAELPGVDVPAVQADCEPAWHLFVILLDPEALRVGRAEIYRALRAENIGVNVHYVPVPWHPYYRELGYERGQWPVAEDAYERMLSLPIFPAMSDTDVDDVIQAVRKVVTNYRK